MIPRINISSEASRENLTAVIQRTIAAIRNWCDAVSREAMPILRPDSRGMLKGRVTPTLNAMTKLDLTDDIGWVIMPKADGYNAGMVAYIVRAKGSYSFNVTSSDPDTLIQGATARSFNREAYLISDGVSEWRLLKTGL